VLFVAGIIFFCFFYVSIIFNPNEAADNMRKYGGFIRHSSGAQHADYMNTILTKITVVGALTFRSLPDPDIMISGIKLKPPALLGNWKSACAGISAVPAGSRTCSFISAALRC